MTDVQELRRHICALESRIERDEGIIDGLAGIEAALNQVNDHFDELDGRIGLIEQSCARMAGYLEKMGGLFELLVHQVKVP
jgi:hypothetical protein